MTPCSTSPLLSPVAAAIASNASLLALAEQASPNRAFAVAVTAASLAASVPPLAAFLALKRDHDYLRLRPALVPVLFFLAQLVIIANTLVPSIVGVWRYPCAMLATGTVLLVPLCADGVFGWYAVLQLQRRFALAVWKYGRVGTGGSGDDVPGSTSTQGVNPLHAALESNLLSLRVMPEPDTFAMPESKRAETLRVLKFLMTPRGQALFVVVRTVPFVLPLLLPVVINNPTVTSNCAGCASVDTGVYGVSLALSSMLIVTVTLVAARSLAARDPWNVQRDGMLTAPLALGMLWGYQASMIKATPDGAFDVVAGAIAACLAAIAVLLNTALPLADTYVRIARAARAGGRIKRRAPTHPRRRQLRVAAEGLGHSGAASASLVESSEKGSVTESPDEATVLNLNSLDAVLNDSELGAAFELHMVAEFASENTAFLKDTRDWASSYSDAVPSARVARARRIVRAYLEDSSTLRVNVSQSVADATRRAVAAAADAPGTLSRDVFKEVRTEVLYMVAFGAFPRFQRTDQYRELTQRLGGGAGGAAPGAGTAAAAAPGTPNDVKRGTSGVPGVAGGGASSSNRSFLGSDDDLMAEVSRVIMTTPGRDEAAARSETGTA